MLAAVELRADPFTEGSELAWLPYVTITGNWGFLEEEEDNRLSDDNPIVAHDSVVVVVKVKGNLAGIGIIQGCGAVAMIIHY